MFKQILIAIDDGAPASSAVDAAAALAEKLGANVILLHVVDINAVTRPDMAFTDRAKLADLQKRGQQLLDRTAARLSKALHTEQLLIEGDPAETIISNARDWGVDLIVIGSDSRGRLAHFLLGSTADAVIRRAPCPVLTVRQPEERAQHKQTSHTRAYA